MKKFGLTYQVVNFTSRLFPKKATASANSVRFIHTVLNFLQQLDQIQEANPRITISFHANDGLWIYSDGLPQVFLKPTQKFLLLHLFEETPLYLRILKEENFFKKHRSVDYAVGLWEVEDSELRWLLEYFKKSWPPSKFTSKSNLKLHPRYIPGDVRQYALTQFIKTGRMCFGVEGRTKKHRVEKNAQIEFDHILPHSEGGSNSVLNVQVLCRECNRIKLATAK